MAVDAPVLYNNWWVYLRATMGSTHLNPNDKQIHNAYLIRSALKQQGYTDYGIAGILGNWQVESGFSPGALDTHLSVLPDLGQQLSLLTNDVMLGYCNYLVPDERGYGTGLAQWDRGVSSAEPHGNVVASYAIRNNMQWYDGDLQMMRLEAEYQADLANPGYIWKYDWGTVSWYDYKNIDSSPSNASDIWATCFEVSDSDFNNRQRRRDNANYWYQYFIDHPLSIPELMTILSNKRRGLLYARKLR